MASPAKSRCLQLCGSPGATGVTLVTEPEIFDGFRQATRSQALPLDAQRTGGLTAVDAHRCNPLR